MKKKIVIATIVAFFVGPQLAFPVPDPATFLVGGALAALLCAVPLLILAGFAFVKTAAQPVHTLVCGLVCLVTILVLLCYPLMLRINSQHRQINSSAQMSHQANHVTGIDLSNVRS